MPLEDGPAPTGEDAGREQADSANRPSRVDQPVAGPSNTSQRQGFCSYCQVLYNSVEQHVLSTRHRELVGRAARTNVVSGSLMQRFLQDVLQHHPHRYNDTRPTHADLPCLNTLPSPREVLSEVYCGSEDDGLSVGTREELPSSDEESCPVVEAAAITPYTSQSQEQAGTSTAVPLSTGAEAGAQTVIQTVEVKLEDPIPEKYSPTQGFLHRTSGDCARLKELPQTVTVASEQPRSVKSFVQSGSPKFQHRKAHRKTNKHREDSDSCTGRPASPAAKCITSEAQQGRSVEETAVRLIVLEPLKGPPRERAFSEQSDHIREVIEDVIERHCYDRNPKPHQQEEESVFHLSLHSINESKDSEEWDNALLRGLEKNNTEDKHLACLMQVNIHVEDQEYKAQLDTALNTVEESLQTEPEVAIENTAEEIIPDLPHIPASFVGKTWTQVMFEDDLKIERMVKEFRQGHFRCYFDSEPLSKSGKRGRRGKKCTKQKQVDATECQDVLPLLEHHEEEAKHLPTFRKTRQRLYRMASRCQVVKVSHGTQTAPLNCPVVRRSSLPETLHSNPEPRKDPSPERTPDMKTRLCALKLPASYCKIMSPLQPKTVVYVLASPDGTQSSLKPTPIKRIGRKRKSSDEECMLKYKYKKTPLKYYDPQTNRILKTPPRGVPSMPKNKSASHIRQLFRSLSPDINKELHGSVHGRSPRGSRKSRGEGSLADLCASTSGSCLDSGGPSEPGSSLTSSRKALFSRSSISTSSHFLLGHTSWAASLTDSSSRAKAHSRADSSLSVAGSKLEEDHAQAQADTPPVRRRKQGPRVTEKPLTPAKKPPAPPYRTRRKSKARAKSRNVLDRRAAGCRVSPRNKGSTRASPRLSGSFQLDL